jgi:hypothetical protein
MYIDPFVPQLLALERMKDTIRRNEQACLVRVAEEGSRQSRRWRWSMIFARKDSLELHNRSQRKQLTANTPNL